MILLGLKGEGLSKSLHTSSFHNQYYYHKRRRLLQNPSLPLHLFPEHRPCIQQIISSITGGSSSSVATTVTATTGGTAAATTAAAVLVPSQIHQASVSFLQLLFAFMAGGCFFSAILIFGSAFYAFGSNNTKRLLEIVRILINSVWTTFTLGLSATKSTLLGGGEGDDGKESSKWQWKDAWLVFKDKLKETRQTAKDSVQAFKAERNLYNGVLGEPVLLPIQYLIDRYMPYMIASSMKEALQETLADFRDVKIKKIMLLDFDAGTKPFKLMGARAYDVGRETIAFDGDVNWDSDIVFKLQVFGPFGVLRAPVTIRNIKFDGTVRILLTPLTEEPPGFGAALVSLPCIPNNISLDMSVGGGELTKVPWLKDEILSIVQKSIINEFLWPKRAVIPQRTIPTNSMWGVNMNKPPPILSKKQLDDLETSDPLLLAQSKLIEQDILLKNYESRFNFGTASAGGGGLLSNTSNEDINCTQLNVLIEDTTSTASSHDDLEIIREY